MNSNFRKLFGKKVRHYRKLNNISQEKLAELVGMSPNTISYIENGKSNIAFAKIPIFSSALNISPYQLFIDTEHETESNLSDKIVELLKTATEKQRAIALNVIKDILDI